jgi:hypothetical protein
MDDLSQAYMETVQAVAQSVVNVRDGEWGDRDWSRIVVNYESLRHTQDPQESVLAFAIAAHPGASPEKVSFRLSPAAEAGFHRVADVMAKSKGQYWTVCDLVIDSDGRYAFDFSYDPPYRLSGNLNDQRFSDYLQKYLAGQR